MDVHFASRAALLLLWTVPLLLLLYIHAARRRKRALELFADAAILPGLTTSVDPTLGRWKGLMVMVGFSLAALALARPGWNPEPQTVERRGRDVVFVVDVSKSMLAEDLLPNRLKRAQFAILDTVPALRGDRVALVAFAGGATVKCPLTHDFGFFRMMVEGLSPQSVSRGGTLIGDALRNVLYEVLDDAEKRFKDIVLITDGEDHDSFPLEAAQMVGERGVRLIAIGLGNEDEGTPIPVTDENGATSLLTHEGEAVLSRLDAETLRAMVKATPGGRYFNVSEGTVDLRDIYLNVIRTAGQKRLESQTTLRYEEKYQLFLVVALVLLALETVISTRRRRT